MKNEEKILEKLEKHDGLLEVIAQNVAKHDGLLEVIVRNVAKHDDQIDLVVRSLLELHDKVDELAPLPARFDAFEERVTTILDGHTHILARLDDERVAHIDRFGRIEGEIAIIKGHLGISHA